MKKFTAAVIGVCMLLAPLMAGSKASALNGAEFTLTSDPTTAMVDLTHITTPPLPGQTVTVNEQVKNANGELAGTAQINCMVLAFTILPEAALLLDCQAHFTLSGGTIDGHAAFWTFQHDYSAAVTGGTGVYQGALGTVRVLDRAPGDETYMFSPTLP